MFQSKNWSLQITMEENTIEFQTLVEHTLFSVDYLVVNWLEKTMSLNMLWNLESWYTHIPNIDTLTCFAKAYRTFSSSKTNQYTSQTFSPQRWTKEQKGTVENKPKRFQRRQLVESNHTVSAAQCLNSEETKWRFRRSTRLRGVHLLLRCTRS